ncbi:Uncharacterised protein [Salmonella enterica subsp. enterica]|uniref:Uncharacterized protein n=1 Tax=Salmonella enterica I TaxID=59201 RepID=A0A447PIU4_SALET|nr:Uncharacterised protein [Salmonella enterica subsp. enterica]
MRAFIWYFDTQGIEWMRTSVRPIRSVRKAVSTSAEKFCESSGANNAWIWKELRAGERANRYHPRHIAIVKMVPYIPVQTGKRSVSHKRMDSQRTAGEADA